MATKTMTLKESLAEQFTRQMNNGQGSSTALAPRPPSSPAPPPQHEWFDERLEADYQQSSLAREIAQARYLSTQVRLYDEHLTDLRDQDKALQVSEMARAQLGSPGTLYKPEQPIVRGVNFIGSFALSSRGRVSRWAIMPIEFWDQRIPPQALVVMHRVEETVKPPEAWWVADVIPVVTSYTSSFAAHSNFRDPLLLAQYGSWLVVVAAWE